MHRGNRENAADIGSGRSKLFYVCGAPWDSQRIMQESWFCSSWPCFIWQWSKAFLVNMHSRHTITISYLLDAQILFALLSWRLAGGGRPLKFARNFFPPRWADTFCWKPHKVKSLDRKFSKLEQIWVANTFEKYHFHENVITRGAKAVIF